jgi:hypothetical protein
MPMRSPLRRTMCLAAVALLLTACGSPASSTLPSRLPSASDAPVASAPPTALPPAATPSLTPSVPPASGDAWVVATIPEPGTFYTDVAALPSRLAIVGLGGQAAQTPLAWSSLDGTTWAAEQPGGDGRTPADAVAWDERLLAIGGGTTGRCGHPAALDSWVREADGRWAEAPWTDDFCIGGSGAVAVAGDHAIFAGVGSGEQPFIWRSTDGLHWTVIPIGSAEGAPRAAATLGGTDLVFGTGATGAWVTRSTDGTNWSAREPLGASPSLDVLAALPLGDRVAVVVRDASRVVGTLTSRDGKTWESALATGLSGDLLARVVPVDGGLVALGGDDAGPRAWASTVGATWTIVPLPTGVGAGATLTGAAIFAGRAWLIGQVQTGSTAVGAAWSGPLSLLGR